MEYKDIKPIKNIYKAFKKVIGFKNFYTNGTEGFMRSQTK